MTAPGPSRVPVGKLAFVEFTSPDPVGLGRVFGKLGMTAIGRHRRLDATLHRQGEINFVVNADPASYAVEFGRRHGPSIAGLAIPVDDPAEVRGLAMDRGARAFPGGAAPLLGGELTLGVGESLLYLVPRAEPELPFRDFVPLPGVDQRPEGFGFRHIDHVTHCVPVPEMKYWVDFYRTIFGFSIVFEFEAKGKASGFHTQAVRDDDMNVCVTILEPTSPESQIQEFMDEYNGSGVQHVAIASEDLYGSVERMTKAGIELMPTPGSYYDMVDARLPGHGERLEDLRRLNILIDGSTARHSALGTRHSAGASALGSGVGDDSEAQPRLLLQVFTRKMVGPIFFEAIQRKGNYSFGEGNAQALFDAIEREQIARGTVRVDPS